jgi:hypothetical protein
VWRGAPLVLEALQQGLNSRAWYASRSFIDWRATIAAYTPLGRAPASIDQATKPIQASRFVMANGAGAAHTLFTKVPGSAVKQGTHQS